MFSPGGVGCGLVWVVMARCHSQARGGMRRFQVDAPLASPRHDCCGGNKQHQYRHCRRRLAGSYCTREHKLAHDAVVAAHAALGRSTGVLGRYTAQLALKDDVTRLHSHKVEQNSQQGYRYESPVMSSEFCDNNTSVCFRRQCFIIDDCCLQKYKKANNCHFSSEISWVV